MVEIKEDPILEQELEELAKNDNINEETIQEIFLAYSTFHIEIELDNLSKIYIMIYTLQDTLKLYERRGC